ncbi:MULTISPECIES: sulfurtransferase complex subunit TusC [Halomonas]|uniref:Intracellular sulfur oxidation protein DsrF n=1 Tax=Halomonas chromatireducens TaxID=507626 RepID=A0A0X8HEI9_9GAMM|nr:MULTISPECIES: sulfurtransferase complex subunit TusC [Halomonas]AMD01172.1 Intracellular sulfur oxidation protein DsrF [Halomonas chromatireducens]MBZ0330418.1 sulfurtransferase complex subunit TusC [Halomonas sp. ANAO-440]
MQAETVLDGDVLVILRHPPHGSSWLREGLDAALVAAAFGQAVSLLFQGDGVLALLKGQGAGPLGQKGTSATLDMLAMYDIESLFLDATSLARLGLSTETLQLPASPLEPPSIAALIAGHRLVLTF